MSRDQLEAFAHRLKNEMEREREERNFFQLERDKLRTFWEITRNQLVEAQATIRNSYKEIEEATEAAEINTKRVVQQMKHLQYENQARIGEIRAEAMTQLKLAQQDYRSQEQELLTDKREWRCQLREKEESNQLELQELNMEHSTNISKIRSTFGKQVEELQEWQEYKLNSYKNNFEIKFKMEMNEIIERKNGQIKKLTEDHDKALNEIKTYYNNIFSQNLTLISTLKEQIEELYSKQSENIAYETLAENEKLVASLEKAQLELIELHKKIEHYERDKIELARFKTKYAVASKQLKNQKTQAEALLIRNNALIEERNCLKGIFDEAVIEFQQKTGLKNILLEGQLRFFQNKDEKRGESL